uniref:Uncharacterized protein n=1 Tax=Rhizophora mucronata TaxID=61149 RepID=A0A2P2JJ38_RHIMU
MSQRPSRHQRRPSQSVIISFTDDLSAPLPDSPVNAVAQPSNQALQQPQQQSHAPLPPSPSLPAADSAQNVAKDDKKATEKEN